MSLEAIIHLIDDDAAVRQSLTFSLATAGYAVRAYASAEAFLAGLPNGRPMDGRMPGCVVSDIRMPGMDGLALQKRLGELQIDLPMIIMTGHADVRLAVQAMKAGARDFLEKPFDDELLLAAIRDALPRPEQAGQGEAKKAEIQKRLDLLTGREKEVLAGLLAGQANKAIAYDLKLSPRTVEVHRANVMAKMNAGSLSELVRMALIAEN